MSPPRSSSHALASDDDGAPLSPRARSLGRPPLHPVPSCEASGTPRAPRASGADAGPPWLARPPTKSEARVAARLGNALARGALTGLTLRGGLHAVSLALAAVAPSRRRRRSAAGAPGLAAAAADTARYAAFVGAFAGAYVAIDEGLAARFGKAQTAGWRAAAAGAGAAPTVLLLGPRARHTSLALYLLLRGATLLVRIGNKPGAHPRVRALLAPTRAAHGDTALMCLACAQITYSWIVQPATLPPAFVRFLDRHGGRAPEFYAAARELAGRAPGDARPPAALARTHLAPLAGAGACPCDWAHPGSTCDGAALSFLPGAVARAVPVYLPVYLVPALLVHGRALFDGSPAAAALWARSARGALRSSAFLALYCTLCWRGACVGFRALGRVSPVGIPATAWVGGLATLVEKKSRRMELATYCLSRALESFALCVPVWVGGGRAAAAHPVAPSAPSPPLSTARRRRARPHPLATLLRPDVAMLAAAAAAVGHAYSDCGGAHRDVFRSKYLTVLDFVLGGDGLDRGSIRHVPSASDLVAAHVAPRVPRAAAPAVTAATAAVTAAASGLVRVASAAWDSVAHLAAPRGGGGAAARRARRAAAAAAANPPRLPGEPPHHRPRFRNHGWEARLSGDPLGSADTDTDTTPVPSPRGPAAAAAGAPLSAPTVSAPPPPPSPFEMVPPPPPPSGSVASPGPRPAWPPAGRAAGAVVAATAAEAAGKAAPPVAVQARPASGERAPSFGGDEALAP